jgi:hypothetical protein
VPYQRLAKLLLEEWRLVERRLESIDPASQEGELLCAEAHASATSTSTWLPKRPPITGLCLSRS